MPLTSRRIGTLLIVIGVACMLVFYGRLARFPDPPGADGYYYLKQIACLSAGDGYYYKDRSIAFAFPAFLAALSGNPLGAFRISVAFTWTVLIFLAGALSYRTVSAPGLPERTKLIFAFIAAIVVAGSRTFAELLLEYYKTAASLLFLLGAVALWHNPAISVKARRFFSALFLCCALVSHKSAVVFILILSVAWFLQNKSGKNAFILAGAGTCALLLFLAFFERGREYLAALPGFLAPPARWFEWLFYTLRNDLSLSLTLGLAFAAVVFYLVERRSSLLPGRALFDTAALLNAITFIPLFVAGPSGPVYRLVLMSPLFSVILLLRGAVRSRVRTAVAGLLAALFLSQVVFDHARTGRHFPRWSDLDKDIMRIDKHVGRRDHLIAHHGLEFYVDHRTGIRARQFLSSDPRKQSFRLAYLPPGRPAGEARAAVDRAKLEQIGEAYALLREEDWSGIVQQYGIPPHWKNPALTRPSYIPDYE